MICTLTQIHKNGLEGIFGGSEETTSGVKRLGALERTGKLGYPVIAVNNARTKYLFDNRYGTGQSTVDGILRATAAFLPGKRFVVCGYGWVGKGVAERAKGMGASVTVTEIDPVRALEAHWVTCRGRLFKKPFAALQLLVPCHEVIQIPIVSD